MRHYFQFKTMLSFIFIFFYAFATAQESQNEINLDKNLMLRKIIRWTKSNINLKKIRPLQHPRVISKDEFIYESLNTFAKELITLEKMELALDALRITEPNWWKKNDNYLRAYIEQLQYSKEEKNRLISYLSSPVRINSMDNQETIENKAPQFSLIKTFNQLNALLENLSEKFFLKSDLLKSTNTIKSILLANLKDDDCYNTDTDCQFDSNKGIIHYQSEKIINNYSVALCSLKIGVKVNGLYRYKNWAPNPHYNQPKQKDLWPIFLEDCDKNPLLTLESISIYGHDVCCNRLNQKDESPILSIKWNNLFRPNQYSDDDRPNSPFYQNGSLGGKALPKNLIRKMKRKLHAYRNYHLNDQEFEEDDFHLRLGYHHVYGGMLMATQLIKTGVRSHKIINLPVMLPQILGYAYKKLQTWDYLSKDAKILYQQNNFNELRKKYKYPQSWSRFRRKKAKANLEFFLSLIEYTEMQHRIGAQFAFQILSQK
ncbi:hypothetical protein N9N67_09830 [Bacteriovoracaceae bacterium]|nr:hypothetical protein [Bacteriovoracaceae bacterium]